MPQVFNICDSPDIKANVSFVGIKRLPLLRWFPYLTNDKPRLKFNVYVRNVEHEIEEMYIGCDAPRKEYFERPEDPTLPRVWPQGDVKETRQHHDYDVTLPWVVSQGEYQYYLTVLIKYDEKSWPKTAEDRIMSTGQVRSRENVLTHIVSAMFGAAVLGLVQFLSRFIN